MSEVKLRELISRGDCRFSIEDYPNLRKTIDSISQLSITFVNNNKSLEFQRDASELNRRDFPNVVIAKSDSHQEIVNIFNQVLQLSNPNLFFINFRMFYSIVQSFSEGYIADSINRYTSRYNNKTSTNLIELQRLCDYCVIQLNQNLDFTKITPGNKSFELEQ